MVAATEEGSCCVGGECELCFGVWRARKRKGGSASKEETEFSFGGSASQDSTQKHLHPAHCQQSKEADRTRITS